MGHLLLPSAHSAPRLMDMTSTQRSEKLAGSHTAQSQAPTPPRATVPDWAWPAGSGPSFGKPCLATQGVVQTAGPGITWEPARNAGPSAPLQTHGLQTQN